MKLWDRTPEGKLRVFGWFEPAKFFRAPFNPVMYAKIAAFAMCLAVLWAAFLGVRAVKRWLFPARVTAPATSTTTLGNVQVKQGGQVNVTNINNPVTNLGVGLYVGLASDRATVGVFKELTPNIDIELGGGKSYDGKAVAEVRARLKF